MRPQQRHIAAGLRAVAASLAWLAAAASAAPLADLEPAQAGRVRA